MLQESVMDIPLVRFTQANLNGGLSNKGSLSAKQFRALGKTGPFKGWKKRLIGQYFTKEQIATFISLKNAHLANRVQKTSRRLKPKNKSEDIYKDPRWKKKRAIIYKKYNFTCVNCGKSRYDGVKLAVHHLLYAKGKDIWEVPDWYLILLCNKCHKSEHSKNLIPPIKHYK